MCLWTCNNNLNWAHTTKNWIDQQPPPSQLSGRQRLYANTSTSYSPNWLIPICLLSVLHLCCWEWMGGICHIVIFLLLTSQFIRWLLGPWWTWVFSLPSLSFFFLSLSLSLFIWQFKENIQQEKKHRKKKKKKEKNLIIKNEGVNDKNGDAPVLQSSTMKREAEDDSS